MRDWFKRLGYVAALALVVTAMPAFATDPAFSLPDIGVDMTEVITTYGIGFGAVILAAVGFILAVRLVRKGVRWIAGG